jgi:hypothetical protein
MRQLPWTLIWLLDAFDGDVDLDPLVDLDPVVDLDLIVDVRDRTSHRPMSTTRTILQLAGATRPAGLLLRESRAS